MAAHSLKSLSHTGNSHLLIQSTSNSPLNVYHEEERKQPVTTTSMARSYSTSQNKTLQGGFEEHKQKAIYAMNKARESDRAKRRSSNTYRNLKNKALNDWINSESSPHHERKEMAT